MDNGASSYRRYLDGEEAAFDEIVKELFDPLVFFIDRYVHDIHAAEDIAIDAFSDLVVHRLRYNFKVQLNTYLFMIGRSRALNYIKHRSRRKELPLEEAACVANGATDCVFSGNTYHDSIQNEIAETAGVQEDAADPACQSGMDPIIAKI